MVRPDHEDGGELNPRDETPEEQTPDEQTSAGEDSAAVTSAGESSAGESSGTDTPRVRRSSPLGGRRKKPARPAAQEAADGGSTESSADAADADAADGDAAVGDAADNDAADNDAADAQAPTAGAAVDLKKAVDSGDRAARADSGDEAAPTEAEVEAGTAAYRQRRRSRSVVRKSAGEKAARDGSKLTIVAVSLTALVVVVGAVLSAVFGYQYYKIDQQRQLRAEYSSFAQQMVVSMTTLNPDNADQMYKNTIDKTSGRAKQMFSENMKQVTDMIRKGDMVTKTTIVADAVSKSEADEGSVLVVYAWEGHPKNDTKNTDFSTFRARVDITRINGDLKMTYFDWVA